MKRYKPLLVKSCLDLILWYDMWKWQLGVCLFVLSKRFPCVSAAWNKGHNLPTKRFIFQTNKKPPHFLLQIRQEVRFMLGKCLKRGIVLKFNWNDYKAFTVKSSLWLRNHTKYIFWDFFEMIEDIDFIKQRALEEKYFFSVFTRTIGNINISKCWYKYLILVWYLT